MRLICCLLVCACLISTSSLRADDWLTFAPKPGPGQGKHVVFLAADHEYRSEEGLPMLAKILSQRHGFKCTVLFPIAGDGTIDPNNTNSLPGASALDSADIVVMLLRYRTWPDEVMQHFSDAYSRGTPMIGLRTSTHAFNYPNDGKSGYKSFNEFGKHVLGEQWVNHWGQHKREATRGIIEPSSKDDPLLLGVTDVFGDTDVYEAYPAADSKILLRGQVLRGMSPEDSPASYKKRRASDKKEQDINDPMMPIAWSRERKSVYGKDFRVFCTTLGSSTDLQNEGLRRLLVNAVFWGLQKEVPAKADVDYVDPYKPSAYGFNGFRKGVKPVDLSLGH
ncbi:MAG TPA: ThuA domain-containing protein [Gemmataceae bacterium]|jgi:hypothetical protein|nr:ThuA domain-containing protein [Gemmataceae bacterium]